MTITPGGACGRRWRAHHAAAAALALVAAGWGERAAACASCGCTLSADAAMGYSALPGWRLSVEYDYIDQDQLRSGTRSVSGVPDGSELEHDTLNRYVTGALSYTPDSSWNVTLLVPYVVRDHSTYGDFDSTRPLPPLSYSRSSSLGDVKLIGSYQGWLPTRNLGVQLGVKLPTGRYGTAVDFNAGPNAGTPLDASLQPGTGSTDLILGVYYYRAVSQDFDAFFNAQFQSALSHHMDQPGNDYRPGNSTTASLGLRYAASSRWVPQVQLNLLHKSPDQGALADVQNSAGIVAYLSPGITVQAARGLQLFGFVQLPVYRNLYGIQLFPRFTASVGVSYAL
ncbi:MAG TPA: transporter [Steroidobacteraceae bacterium]|nr:transporter [Steroidobacteraceae bacterium]